MSQAEVVRQWMESAESDWDTARVLFANGKYAHCLFFCHLTLEKHLNALFVQRFDTAPPATHDVEYLARKVAYPLTESILQDFAEVVTFNVEARYDIDKQRLYKKATKAYTREYMQKIEEISVLLPPSRWNSFATC